MRKTFLSDAKQKNPVAFKNKSSDCKMKFINFLFAQLNSFDINLHEIF